MEVRPKKGSEGFSSQIYQTDLKREQSRVEENRRNDTREVYLLPNLVERSSRTLAQGLRRSDQRLKRVFDFSIALCGLLFLGLPLLFALLLASIDTKQFGLFSQMRVGRHGKLFRVFKLRTMRNLPAYTTSVTTETDPRITKMGRQMRRLKIDELPQLWNVLIGDMSLVGPRPDVPGYADQLMGQDRLILEVRPGITGPATLKYRNEEKILARQVDPETYNREVIFVDKVKLNRDYVFNYSFRKDLYYLKQTLFGNAAES